MKLQGKVAIVTGGARGIGRAYVLRLAHLGADVVIADVDLNGAAQYGEQLTSGSVREEVEALGRRAIAVQCDLTQRQAALDLAEQTLQAFGRIDILVNNAGGLVTPVERSQGSIIPEEDVRTMMDVNLMTTIFCCQAVIPTMVKQRSGVIVNVSSGTARNIVKGGRMAIYGSVKAAVTHFTRNLAMELGPSGIRVNAISPGLILSARIRKTNEQRGLGTAEDVERLPMRRLGEPEDCANALEFLATDLSSYVTGQCISVCGGSSLQPA
ncbi:SDR family NAD(P)-dependent oxidoreductase [Variovorax guangxiensis]|uniref:SDR family oxidoreductase n=1 Tax=Variovorax guangxiensis TaxID=1775474 RepID=A0A502DL69_9BURK|nr:SDR family NAD(P)-dependent oxidoreductase [Variovorax guangxiensis]TPG22160.1 SDR family oxidoreductase [Variovorax ginsengisoli]TPG26048.1 SDR family oxidoreductase [Variovorax guangxiensis]